MHENVNARHRPAFSRKFRASLGRAEYWLLSVGLVNVASIRSQGSANTCNVHGRESRNDRTMRAVLQISGDASVGRSCCFSAMPGVRVVETNQITALVPPVVFALSPD